MTSTDTSPDASFDVPDPSLQTPFDPMEFPAAEATDWPDDDDPDWRNDVLAEEIASLRSSIYVLVEGSPARFDRTHVALTAMAAFAAGAAVMSLFGAG